MANIGRLVLLAPIRYGRQIRCIGFDQHAIKGALLRHLLDDQGILERNDAGKREMETKIEGLPGNIPAFRKTMHYPAHGIGALLEHYRESPHAAAIARCAGQLADSAFDVAGPQTSIDIKLAY